MEKETMSLHYLKHFFIFSCVFKTLRNKSLYLMGGVPMLIVCSAAIAEQAKGDELYEAVNQPG